MIGIFTPQKAANATNQSFFIFLLPKAHVFT